MSVHDNDDRANLISHKDEYHEALESIRHYSRLRFNQLAVFYAANAALVYMAFRTGETGGSARYFAAFIGGVILAVLFFSLEYIHDAYKSSFFKVAEKLGGKDGQIARRPKHLALPIRCLLFGMYISVGLFWVSFF